MNASIPIAQMDRQRPAGRATEARWRQLPCAAASAARVCLRASTSRISQCARACCGRPDGLAEDFDSVAGVSAPSPFTSTSTPPARLRILTGRACHSSRDGRRPRDRRGRHDSQRPALDLRRPDRPRPRTTRIRQQQRLAAGSTVPSPRLAHARRDGGAQQRHAGQVAIEQRFGASKRPRGSVSEPPAAERS